MANVNPVEVPLDNMPVDVPGAVPKSKVPQAKMKAPPPGWAAAKCPPTTRGPARSLSSYPDTPVDDARLKFGKYKGKSFLWVWENDAAYVSWCVAHLKTDSTPNHAAWVEYITEQSAKAEFKASADGHSKTEENEYYYWYKGEDDIRREKEADERFSRLERDMTETRQFMTEMFQRMQTLEASVTGLVQALQQSAAAPSS